MEFSSLIIPVDDHVKGLLKFNVVPKIGILNLVVEAHQLSLKVNDPKMVQKIMSDFMNGCDVRPYNNDTIFNMVSSKILFKKEFDYVMIENLNDELCEVKKLELNNEENVTWKSKTLDFQAKVRFRHLKRIQLYVESLIKNYPFILDIVRYVNVRLGDKEEITNNKISPTKKETQVHEVEFKPETLLDQILEFMLVSPVIFRNLIGLIYNFYRFQHGSKIIDKEIQLQPLFPSSITTNQEYFIGLLDAVELIPLETCKLYLKNLMQLITKNQNELTSLEIQICGYIFFWFIIRNIIEIQKNYILNNWQDFINTERIQNLFDRNLKFEDFKFKIIDSSDFDTNEILEISNKYNYLRGLDQEKFAELVFNETSEKSILPKLGFKTIINLKDFLDEPKLNESEFELKYPLVKTKLFNYKQNKDNIITDDLKLFLDFLENPVCLMTSKISVPSNIINTFEILKNFLNDLKMQKDNISTLDYYLTLTELLPDDFPFEDILYIIYQIVIPYSYFVYGNTLFEDVFLNKINPSKFEKSQF